jgi:hypothetical protein
MTKYIIRIFSNFCPSENCKDVYERLSEISLMENYGKDKKYFITNDDDYTHVIILNTAMPEIHNHIPKQNVIGFAFEPPQYLMLNKEFVEYAKQKIGKYFIGDNSNLREPFIEKHSYMWHNAALKYIPTKSKIMSIMVSEKVKESGHLYRHLLAHKILETDLPIDIYGKGCFYYNFMKDERVKGGFKELEPYENYHYHISIENCQINEYYSEKIMNPLLCETTPIYLGCNNIENYFPNMTIRLSGNINEDMELLKRICKNVENYKKKIDVEEIKNKIFLLRNIEKLFE